MNKILLFIVTNIIFSLFLTLKIYALEREVRGYPYGPQIDIELLQKEVIFECSQEEDGNFEVEKYFVVLNNNPDYSLRRLSFNKTNQKFDQWKRYDKFRFKNDEDHYRNDILNGSYINTIDSALIYGPILTEILSDQSTNAHKLDKMVMKYNPANYLTASYLIYVYGKFDDSDSHKILAIRPFSNISDSNIIEAKDFDNYKIDCSPEERENSDTSVITSITRGDLLPGLKITFKDQKFDQNSASIIQEKLNPWLEETNIVHPINNLLFFELEEDDLKSVMIDNDGEKTQIFNKLVGKYFNYFKENNKDFTPQFLDERPNSWENIKFFGLGLDYENQLGKTLISQVENDSKKEELGLSDQELENITSEKEEQSNLNLNEINDYENVFNYFPQENELLSFTQIMSQ